MARGTFRVRGLRQFQRAVARAGPDSRKQVRAALRAVGDPVRIDATNRFTPYNARSAANYRVVVRQRGVAVDQRLRKTTGLRPDYGALQMRKALLPALAANQKLIEQELEHALDRIADHFASP